MSEEKDYRLFLNSAVDILPPNVAAVPKAWVRVYTLLTSYAARPKTEPPAPDVNGLGSSK
jgi:hypothetical protein